MKRCDVIIPIYNALDCVKDCINSVIKNTDLSKNGLILIDDKSPDSNVRSYLKDLEINIGNLNITILYNENNLGFVGTVNKGMKYSKNDVLLLNSDTEVPANWLDRIQECAYSEENIATVTPLSNNATLVSVPIGLQPNDLPSNITFEEYADLIARNSNKDYPVLPTSHGFCMFIKRDVIDRVGYFDEETFGKGYGEENDFAYRCLDFGYKHVLCDNVIVYHKESQSFSEAKEELIKSNLKILANRYPNYVHRTNMWLQQFPIKNICKKIQYLINLHNRTNILFLIHDWSNVNENVGGTTIHCLDLIQTMRNKYNFHVLAQENGRYKLHSYFETEEQVMFFNSIYNPSVTNLFNKEYKNMIENILLALGIDVIHIHHMIDHYFDVVDIAKEHNVKIMMTIHDFYCLCPSINMLYNMEKYCLPMNNVNCAVCLRNKLGIHNDIIKIWRERWINFLNQMDVVITPSQSTKEIVEKELGEINCKVIEHGVNLNKIYSNLSIDSIFNVAFVGVMAKHKGAEVIESLINETKDDSIMFHVFGDSEYSSLKENKKNFLYHGRYKREDLPHLLEKNNIHLVCNLSIWPETYSYTLTETIACGVPVLSYDIGAVAERIKKYGYGWVVPTNINNNELIQYILNIKNNPDDYTNIIKNLNAYDIKSVELMCEAYDILYTVDYTHDRYQLEKIINDEDTISYGYNPMLDQILNSRKWKLISKIKVPEPIRNIAKKIIK